MAKFIVPLQDERSFFITKVAKEWAFIRKIWHKGTQERHKAEKLRREAEVEELRREMERLRQEIETLGRELQELRREMERQNKVSNGAATFPLPETVDEEEKLLMGFVTQHSPYDGLVQEIIFDNPIVEQNKAMLLEQSIQFQLTMMTKYHFNDYEIKFEYQDLSTIKT